MLSISSSLGDILLVVYSILLAFLQMSSRIFLFLLQSYLVFKAAWEIVFSKVNLVFGERKEFFACNVARER